MGRLQETFVTLIALERAICWVFVRATVANKRILLLEAHLTLFTLERPLFRVSALVLPQVRGPFEAFPACCAGGRDALQPAGTGGAAVRMTP